MKTGKPLILKYHSAKRPKRYNERLLLENKKRNKTINEKF